MQKLTSTLLIGLVVLSGASFAHAEDSAPAAMDVRAPSTSAPRKGQGRVRMQAARAPHTASAAGDLVFQSFAHAPFPYDGEIPGKGKPFLDAFDGSRRGHTSPRGGVNWEDTTYSDNRALLYVPKTFNPSAPAAIVVFFHGNLARLDRDVRGRQRVPLQLAASKLNAILVAPQFAVNALDSSAGKFYQPGAFGAFMVEADDAVTNLTQGRLSRDYLKGLPIIIVAYSGGYLPAAFTLFHMHDSDAIKGVILLDALYGEVDKFVDWLAEQNQHAFFFSAYSQSSAAQNVQLRKMLAERGIRSGDGLPSAFVPGVVSFLSVRDAVHNDFVTSAWTADPLKVALSRVHVAAAGEALAPAEGNRPPSSLPSEPVLGDRRPTSAVAPSQTADRTAAVQLHQIAPRENVAPGHDGWFVQVGAFPNEAAAVQRAEELRRRYVDVLATRDISVRAETSASGRIYRLKIIDITEDESRTFCKIFLRGGDDCFRNRRR